MDPNSTLDQKPLAAIILAAGEAKRFGAPKQLLVWKGQTLVERAVQSAIDADCEKVVVVTGAHNEAVTSTLQSFSDSSLVSLSQNPNWADGMHTSIACGTKALLEQGINFKSVLITLADQPLIDGEFLRKLIDAQRGHDASALAYPSGPGVPACFGARVNTRLLNLNTDGGGAKAILRDPTTKINVLRDLERRLDIDTFTDWNDFNNTNH